MAISKELEIGIYNYSSKEANRLKIIIRWDNPLFTQLYIDRLRSIYINLKNSKLLKELVNEEITPEMLAFMTHQEMNAEHWKEFIDKKGKETQINIQMICKHQLICLHVKNVVLKNAHIMNYKTRSADEPATIFVTCLDCGKNWKS